MKIKVNIGIEVRKFPKKKPNFEDEFVPLLAGTYRLGPVLEGRVQILREGKAAVFLEPENCQTYLDKGDVEIFTKPKA